MENDEFCHQRVGSAIRVELRSTTKRRGHRMGITC
ncbi:hypothetical protein COLO4_24308 [Corchorus olitorius]|uniref:Uncharacterized protein n=1 Tax=Corchorus olitorius TaxID=93759 RepID=A0A1R3IBC8_9ROSI|nr:hypothetical protein COLO4_24308 [Corchorus olitorius]